MCVLSGESAESILPITVCHFDRYDLTEPLRWLFFREEPMASYEKREQEHNGKKVTKWKATVTIKGFPRTSKVFERRGTAIRWAEKTEYEFKNIRVFGAAHHANKTTAEAIDRYLANLRMANPARMREVGPIMEWWKGQLGHFKLCDVSKDQLYRCRDQLKASHIKGNPKLGKLSNARVNRYMAALERLFNVACNEWDWIAKSPLSGIEKLPEPTGRTRFLADDERGKLLEAAKQSENRQLYTVVLLALTTGARRGELERIQVKHVDVANQKILVPITKTKKPRMLRLVEPALSQVVAAMEKRLPDDFLFASSINPSQPNFFRRSWNMPTKFHRIRNT
jgi:integrase